MYFMDLISSDLFNILLLPKFSTDCAAAIDDINKDKSSSILFFKQIDITECITSPAPTLSTILFPKAGQ